MKILALFFALLTSLTVLAQGDPTAGKAKSTTCVACHGTDGNSPLAINPILAGQHESYLLKQLKDFKKGAESSGKEGRYNALMAGMVTPLSLQDMQDLAAYYASQTPLSGTTPPDAIELGKTLYLVGDKKRGIMACVACHGPRGNGTPLSGFPKISGQHADYIKAQLEAFRADKRRNDKNNMMRLIAAKLTDEQIQALSLYLGGLH